jgi:hypothetical protein
MARWSQINKHLPGFVSAMLIMLYICYIFVARTILDVFNCVPTAPPDGNLYLQAVFEVCGKPGGVQLTLLPYGVLALVVYVVGYPVFVAQLVWRHRELIMQDQLLRARGMGEDRLSNPHAFAFRRMWSRLYYQFRPAFFFWVLAILVRKFCLAFTSLIFSRNSSFQMAACVLILFIAYAGQVRFNPYMSPGAYDDEVRRHLELSATSPLHGRLRATLASIEQRGRKRTQANKLAAQRRSWRASRAWGLVRSYIMDLNTVEATLLFAACIISLMGVLYETSDPRTDARYSQNRDAITAVVMTVIAFSIAYWALVLVVDLTAQWATVARRVRDAQEEELVRRGLSSGGAAGRRPSKGGGTLTRGPSADGGGSGGGTPLPDRVFSDGLHGPLSAESTSTNPMFFKKQEDGSLKGAVEDDHVYDAVVASVAPPPPPLWSLVRDNFTDMFDQVSQLRAELAAAKTDNARLAETLEDAGLVGLVRLQAGATVGSAVQAVMAASDRKPAGRAGRVAFGQSMVTSEAATAAADAAAGDAAAEDGSEDEAGHAGARRTAPRPAKKGFDGGAGRRAADPPLLLKGRRGGGAGDGSDSAADAHGSAAGRPPLTPAEERAKAMEMVRVRPAAGVGGGATSMATLRAALAAGGDGAAPAAAPAALFVPAPPASTFTPPPPPPQLLAAATRNSTRVFQNPMLGMVPAQQQRQ